MTTANTSILGTGWSFPPTFSRETFSVNLVSDEKDIRRSLWIIFSTVPGERVMVPTFGCDLWRLVFRALDTRLKTEIEDSVRTAVLNWEPRIDVDSIEISEHATITGMLLISLDYTIRRTNVRSNLVYPFYLQEGTLVSEVP